MKKISPILILFLTVISLSVLIFKPSASSATDAGLLSNGVQQFFDSSGNPLTSGKVYFYEVGTSTFKDTYTSSAATIINQNPITLNAGGKAPTGGIYGIGLYRQLLKDRNGNVIWDAVTSPGSGGGSTPTDVGDGNLVGTVLPWSGLVAPNQYVFAYGQELSRTTYPEFYTATTLQSNVICSASSNILTGVADTTQIPVGAAVELSLCVTPGTTVVSKTASTVTLSNPSSVSINAVATFFPYGNGNGTTTFNVPDLRGYAVAGRDNMGGSAAGRLTATYFNTAGLGAVGGSQSHTQTISEMAMHDHGVIIGNTTSQVQLTGLAANTILNATNNTGLDGGATRIQLSGQSGTSTLTQQPHTHTATISTSGLSNPFTIVQPTITLNYIIKVTPDTSTSIATGVYSIGGMTGVIACGSGILCTGNIISWVGTAGGNTNNIQYKNLDGSLGGSDNFNFISPNNLTLGSVGTSFLFDIFGSTSGRVRQTVPAIAGTTNIVWGNSSGTPAVTASLPIVLNTTTGNLTCPTCATSTLNGAALTKTDDTNVTLTLGGSPTTALLNATSLTLGWSGQLGLTRGGTASSLTASNGGLVYSTASALAILPGTATAGQIPRSGSSAAPSWSTATYPATTTAGTVLVSATANTITSTATPTLGASGTLGSITMGNATSGLLTLQPVAGALSSSTVLIPAANDTLVNLASSQALTNKTYNGNTWTAGTGTLTIAASKILTVNNTITLNGTDSSIYTFPNASATIPRVVASGAKALSTTAISSAACSSIQTDTATGILTTDAPSVSFNGDPTGVTGYVPSTNGMLSIIYYPTADTMNFKVCNNTTATITPGNITINWRVVR